MPVTMALPRIDPQLGVHRQMPPPWTVEGIESKSFERAPSAQDRIPAVGDARYPHRDTPQIYAQGQWAGFGVGPVGYAPLDYGHNPTRIPKLWKDYTRAWAGISQHGFTQQNYRLHLYHLRPAYPTRGYRSISGVLTNQGPTSSRVRIPAIYVPSAVS